MRMLMEGGIVAWLVIGAGMLHGLIVIVQLALCKKVDFSGYLWAGYAGILALGALGCIQGLTEAVRGATMADPAMRAALIAGGAATALSIGTITSALCIPGLFFTGIAASLARNLSPVRIRQP